MWDIFKKACKVGIYIYIYNIKKYGHASNFSEKVQKKVKIFKTLGKNVQNFKILWKRVASCERPARICPDIYIYTYIHGIHH